MTTEDRYDGRTGADLRRLLDLPRVVVARDLASTQDAVHGLAELGAPAGTLVVADAQTAGRGRAGHGWRSEAGAGIWMTLLERPRDPAAIGVLSLRLAIRLAAVLDRWAAGPVRVKWPNDLYVGDRKLAGILTEARWRGTRLDWVAIGIGINVRVPASLDAAALIPGTDRVEVLAEVVPAVRAAAAAGGALTTTEVERFDSRDLARGRACREPARGVAAGITPDGALIIHGDAGTQTVRAGSLVLEELS